MTQPLLPESTSDLATYRAAGGYGALCASRSDVDLLGDILTTTDLTGLGGAHFPFARKLSVVLSGPSPRFVVCNAAEDEPGSQKDRTLLERNPHVVLEGSLLAAAAVGAEVVFVYVSEILVPAIESLSRALAELDSSPDLLGGVELRIVKAPTAYVAGEASAAVEAIAGRDAKPRAQPPYPAESGIEGQPTLVSNCETLANLPRVVLAGKARPHSTWSRLVTLTGDVQAPGVYEVIPDEVSFGELIERAGGMLEEKDELKAIQPGGPSSAFMPSAAADVLLDDSAIVAAGSQPGCLAVRVLSRRRCIVEDLCELTSFFAREQCGQCPACRMKTQNYAGLMKKIKEGGGRWEMLSQFEKIDEFVLDMPSSCALIAMPTPPIMSGMTLFREDFAAHIEAKVCAVG